MATWMAPDAMTTRVDVAELLAAQSKDLVARLMQAEASRDLRAITLVGETAADLRRYASFSRPSNKDAPKDRN